MSSRTDRYAESIRLEGKTKDELIADYRTAVAASRISNGRRFGKTERQLENFSTICALSRVLREDHGFDVRSLH